MNKPRVLFIDIETSPMIGYVWQGNLYDTSIRLPQLIKDTNIISFGAKWLGSKEIIYEDLSKAKDKKNDKRLCKSISALLHEADIVVVQNGIAFDIRTIKARMMFNGLPPTSPFKVIDTFRQAKRQFKFSYNSLEFLAIALGCKHRKLKHKKFPGLELWKECLAGNQEAWAEMKEYNIYDVLTLEDVYLVMRPWITEHPNLGTYTEDYKPVCPKCGSESLKKEGFRISNSGKYRQYSCKDCGGYARGKTQLLSLDKRKSLLVN